MHGVDQTHPDVADEIREPTGLEVRKLLATSIEAVLDAMNQARFGHAPWHDQPAGAVEQQVVVEHGQLAFDFIARVTVARVTVAAEDVPGARGQAGGRGALFLPGQIRHARAAERHQQREDDEG